MGADIVLLTFSVFLNWTLCNSLMLMAIEASGLDLSSLFIVELGVACKKNLEHENLWLSNISNYLWNLKKWSKLCFETKSTKLGVGHFTSISGHFLANFIDSFHKTEVLTVILMGPTCQNLIWIKSYNINH